MTVDRSTYYTHLHADEFEIDWIGFYDRLDAMTAATRSRLRHHLDLAYGEHHKQKLDLYQPEAEGNGSVFVFLHGGGFVEGDRCHYGCVADAFAKHGVLTVVPSYRLAPDFHYPDQPDDVKDVLSWIHAHIGDYGGNRDRIYLGGHSAGAIMSADVALQPEWLAERSLPTDLVKGIAAISGPYDARDPAIGAYLADPDDHETADRASPLLHVRNIPWHTLIALGSLEPEWTDSNREMAQKIQDRGGSAEFLLLEGMGHDQTALALCDAEGELFQAIAPLLEG